MTTDTNPAASLQRLLDAMPHVTCPHCRAHITTYTWYVPSHRLHRRTLGIRWSRRCPGSLANPAPLELTATPETLAT